MTRRERMLATMRGETVDRPAFNFYEIHGCQDIHSTDPFCIFPHPSWHPLIELARDRTDRLSVCKFPARHENPDDVETKISFDENGSRIIESTRRIGSRTFRQSSKQDLDVNTVWTTEHWLKSDDDLRAWLDAPPSVTFGRLDTESFLQREHEIGDSGLAVIDVADPICFIGSLFDMETYMFVAFTDPALFRRALDRIAESLLPAVEAVAAALPGRLWRIIGPEYASSPYLPPHLFREFVIPYLHPIVESIQRHGGWARVHSHGRLHDILDDICSTGCAGLDPIEPPPQGDVELAYVREKYGRDLVLFGNLEASDIELLPTPRFAEKVCRALDEGTRGEGRGFVLQPSASPYGRVLSPLAMRNYEAMVEIAGG